MKRVIAIGSALAMLAIPAGAAAKPDHTDRVNAAKECRTERGATDATREAFVAKYGTNGNKRNAFGKCVSRRAKDEAKEGVTAHKSAVTDCKAERDEIGAEAFAAKYGTGKNGKNALGKCVSTQAKAKEQEADAEDQEQIADRKSAAKTCDEERGTTAESKAAFGEKYGTNDNNRNAFGKCVSQTAKALHEEHEDEQENETQA
jgi:hypothetical protein